MITYQPGEIVLIAFPFSDQVRKKRRPALVLLDAGDDDILVARITSKLVQTPFDVPLLEWQQAGLLMQSVVRLHKLATIEKSLVERRIGVLETQDKRQIRRKVLQISLDLLRTAS